MENLDEMKQKLLLREQIRQNIRTVLEGDNWEELVFIARIPSEGTLGDRFTSFYGNYTTCLGLIETTKFDILAATYPQRKPK